MPRARTAASTGGASWRRASGQKPVGLTLSIAEITDLRSVAGGFNLSSAEFSRRLVRWALKAFSDGYLRDQKKVEKIIKADLTTDSTDSSI